MWLLALMQQLAPYVSLVMPKLLSLFFKESSQLLCQHLRLLQSRHLRLLALNRHRLQLLRLLQRQQLRMLTVFTSAGAPFVATTLVMDASMLECLLKTIYVITAMLVVSVSATIRVKQMMTQKISRQTNLNVLLVPTCCCSLRAGAASTRCCCLRAVAASTCCCCLSNRHVAESLGAKPAHCLLERVAQPNVEGGCLWMGVPLSNKGGKRGLLRNSADNFTLCPLAILLALLL